MSSLADVQPTSSMAISPSKTPFQANKHQIKSERPEFDKYRPYFGWVNADTIRDTFKHTTQWGASVGTFPMKRHFKSRNPALNVPRRYEAVATDTFYSDTPAVHSGVKHAQGVVGKDSLVSDIYPVRSGKQFVNTLEDNIHRHGAMDKLISDSAKTEISYKVKDILRAYNISDWQSVPYHQNQNPAEWRYRTIKAWTNTIMNRTGTPAHCWLLTLQYVCYILNHISTVSLGGPVTLTVYIKSRHDDVPTSSKTLPEFNPDDLVGRTFLLPPGDNGERLGQKLPEKWLKILSRQMEKESKNSALYLVVAMEKWKRSYPITNLWIIWKLQPMKSTRAVMICPSLEPSLAIRGPSSQQTPIGKDAITMSL